MRKFWNFVPIQLTVFLILGILFGSFFQIEVNLLLGLLSILIVLFFIIFYFSNTLFETSNWFLIIVYVLTFFIGITSITFQNHQNKSLWYANQQEFSTIEPQKAILLIRKILKSNAYNDRYEATVIAFNTKKSLGKILLNIKKDSLIQPFNVDDKLFVYALFNEIALPKNPYQFSYKNYLKNQQIHHQIYTEYHQILNLGNSKQTLKGLAATIRRKINTVLVKNGFKNDELSIINALLLGQRQHISTQLMQSYTGAGAIHILAVSGLHVGIILLILTFLLKPLHYFKHGKWIASFGVVLLLWVFAIIAGLSASVVRAVAMFTAVAVGMYSNRPSNVYNTLIISMFFLVLFHSNYLFEVGFQLSYLAVFSIVWIQPKFYNLWIPKNWLFHKIWQILTVSIAAQIGVLPLSLYYFHQFPGLFFISNLVIIPVLGIVLILGITVITLASFELLPKLLADGYIFILQQLNNFVSWVSNQEFFIIQNITFSIGLLIVSYGVILFLFKWTEKKNYGRFSLLLVAVVAFQIVLIFNKYQLQISNQFIVFNKNKVSVLGHQKGNCLKVVTSAKNVTSSENILKNYLVGSGVSTLEISNKIKNIYAFENTKILIIDSLCIYKTKKVQSLIILLRNSPKINLDRLILWHCPVLIIADGSNYKSYIKVWKKTCLKTKTPFYSTMQNGAYVLKKGEVNF